MIRRPPRSTRTDTRFPITTLYRSPANSPVCARSNDKRQPLRSAHRPQIGAASAVQSVGSTNSTPMRSEEHTSELQSLMRIPYAVCCLKKKHHTKRIAHTTTTYQTQQHAPAHE